ncbi:MAG: MFS transporter [bacterium]|nr:MFS transporter [bacterium]
MRHRYHARHITKHERSPITLPAILGYLATMLFFFLADGIVAYSLPIVTQDLGVSILTVGIILSMSSLTGLISDLAFPNLFPSKTFRFYIRLTTIFGLMTALSLFGVPHGLIVLAIASLLWGVYFETVNFAHYSFISQVVAVKHRAATWGWLEVIKAIAYTTAPILAIWLMNFHTRVPFLVVFGFFLLGYAAFELSKKWMQNRGGDEAIEHPHTLKQELHVWRVLMKKVWHIYGFYLTLVLLDVSFWSVGILLATELSSDSTLGNYLLPAYLIPSLLVPLLISQTARRWEKKRTAFISAGIGSLLLILGFLFAGGWQLLLTIFVGSIFVSLSLPEINSTFEELAGHLGLFGGDLIGLQRSGNNLSWILGPMCATLIATFVGTQLAMAVFSGLLLLAAVSAGLLVPRRIRLSEQAVL